MRGGLGNCPAPQLEDVVDKLSGDHHQLDRAGDGRAGRSSLLGDAQSSRSSAANARSSESSRNDVARARRSSSSGRGRGESSSGPALLQSWHSWRTNRRTMEGGSSCACAAGMRERP